MRLLQYKELDLKGVKPTFAKVRAAIEADDFKSPDVKKLHTGGYYRAKLDHGNRLLLQFARYGRETVCLALEVIENHAYEKSHASCAVPWSTRLGSSASSAPAMASRCSPAPRASSRRVCRAP